MGYRTTRQQLKTMRPRDTRTIGQVCALDRDNFTAGDFWICLEGTTDITIVEQKTGGSVRQKITVPRATFNRLVDWYLREQKTSKAA